MTPPVLAASGREIYAATSLVPAAVILLALPLAMLATARLQRWIPRIRETARATPLRSLLVGIFAAVTVLLLAAANGANPIFGIPFVLAFGATAILGFLGFLAEARDLGCTLRDRDPAAPGVEGGSAAVGWLVLAGVPLVGGVGPLVILYLALRSAGAAALALTTK